MRSLALSVLAGLLLSATHCAPAKSPSQKLAAERREPSSNVEHRDYVGSKTCAECHADVAAKVFGSPMFGMTRDAVTATVRAPFSGQQLRLAADTATMLTVQGRRYIELRSQRDGASTWRVTKVIGGRTREDYAAVRVAGPLDTSLAGVERIMPVSWLIFDQRIRYKGYSVMTPERDALRPGVRWRSTCIGCHNTVSTLTASLDQLHGPGAPSYQGSVSFILPKERTPHYRVSDSTELARALEREIGRFEERPLSDVTDQGRLAQAIRATRRGFDEPHLVELGIGCEACHGGGREHAARPSEVKTSFAFRAPFAHIERPDGKQPEPAEDENRSCARCHTVLFTRYPHAWEGSKRSQSPGGSHINSGEARDFMLGGCSTALRCSDCHDPHSADSPSALETMRGPKGTALCTGCHEQYADASARLTHTRHSDTGAGCIDCHMARKNMGLDYGLTTYHRIGSPTDPERLYGDRPMECALCHTGWSTSRLSLEIAAWLPQPPDPRRLSRLYGDLDDNHLAATLRRGKPHERATAAALAASGHHPELLGELLAVLEDPYPLVRLFALDAIGRLSGERPPVDEHAPGKELRRAVEAWSAGRLDQTAVKRSPPEHSHPR